MVPAPAEPDIDPRQALAALGCADPSTSGVKGGWDTLLWRFRTPMTAGTSRIYFLPGRDEIVRRECIALRCASAGCRQ
jgi:hypothetical protein